jgi:hypothetical protein
MFKQLRARSIKRVAILATFLLALPLSPTSAWANAATDPGAVDQFQLNGTEQNQAICCGAEFPLLAQGQSFTVGAAGVLTGLELSLFTSAGPSDLVVSILDMEGGDPRTAPVLGSVSVPADAVGPIASTLALDSITGTFVDLAPLGISVTPGDRLAFRLTAASPLPSLWAIQTSIFTDRYSGGEYFTVASDGSLAFFGDAAFKTFIRLPLVDEDGDGVSDPDDSCAGTVLPDRFPELKTNRYAANATGTFVSGLRNAPVYTAVQTKGCSGIQIIALEGLGAGHIRYGLSRSSLEAFIAAHP